MNSQGAAKDKAWLKENRQLLAAFGANSFREKGKGAVVIHDQTPGQIPERILYLPEAEIPSDHTDTGRMVREYDPRKEFVVLMIRPDINSSYRFRCS